MPLDPSIALNVKPPQLMTPVDALSLQNIARQNQLGQLQLEDATRARSEQEALREALRNPGAFDTKTGTISLEGLNSAFAASPEAGMRLSKERQASLKQIAEMAKLDADTIKARVEAAGKQADLGKQAYEAASIAYEQAKARGIPEEQAVAAGRSALLSKIDDFDRGGLSALAGFTPEAIAKARSEAPDPGMWKSRALTYAQFLTDLRAQQGHDITIRGQNMTASTAARGQDMTASTAAAGQAVTMRGQNMQDARARDAQATASSSQRNSQENAMRDDFTKASTEFVKVRDAHQRVIASAADPSAAGDLALIFNYMKVLDPGSTVREGEFATAQNSGGVDSRAIAMYNKVLSGERLAPEVRADFVDRSTRLYKGAVTNQERIESDFGEKAVRAGSRPEQVVTRHRVSEPQKQDKPAPTPLNSSEQAELEALRKKHGRR